MHVYKDIEEGAGEVRETVSITRHLVLFFSSYYEESSN